VGTRVRNNQRRREAAGAALAKPAFPIRLAPGKQLRSRNPVAPRCRGRLPETRKALLDDAQLCFFRPTPTPTGVNDIKATDFMTVCKDIHNDSQSHAAKTRKAAHAGCLLFFAVGGVLTDAD
jgi:hypothetical protein